MASDPTITRTIARLADDAGKALAAIAVGRAAARANAWAPAGVHAPDHGVSLGNHWRGEPVQEPGFGCLPINVGEVRAQPGTSRPFGAADQDPVFIATPANNEHRIGQPRVAAERDQPELRWLNVSHFFV